jgi:hypothetical protein
MDHVAAELARLSRELVREPPLSERRGELYAAQQALAWALEPVSLTPPLDTINQIHACSPPRHTGAKHDDP